jgi:hypothetical protein
MSYSLKMESPAMDDLITHHFSRRTREEAVRGDVGSRTAIVAGRV